MKKTYSSFAETSTLRFNTVKSTPRKALKMSNHNSNENFDSKFTLEEFLTFRDDITNAIIDDCPKLYEEISKLLSNFNYTIPHLEKVKDQALRRKLILTHMNSVVHGVCSFINYITCIRALAENPFNAPKNNKTADALYLKLAQTLVEENSGEEEPTPSTTIICNVKDEPGVEEKLRLIFNERTEVLVPSKKNPRTMH